MDAVDEREGENGRPPRGKSWRDRRKEKGWREEKLGTGTTTFIDRMLRDSADPFINSNEVINRRGKQQLGD